MLAKVNGYAYKPTSTLTFGELARRWRESVYPHLEPSTRYQNRWHVDKFLLPLYSDYQIEAVTQEALQWGVARMAARTTGPVIRNIVGTLQGLFKIGREWGYPCPPILRKVLKIPSHVPRGESMKFYSIEEAMQICEQAGPYFGFVFRVQMALGLRPCEVLGLMLGDFDFANKRVTIRRKAWGKHLRVTKAKREKFVALSPELEEALGRFLKSEWIPNPENLLFCNVRRKTALRYKFLMYSVLHPTLERLEFPKRGLHAFRHTAASVVFGGNVQRLAISKVLGHSPNSPLDLLYEHILGNEDVRAANLLGATAFGMSKKASAGVGRTDGESAGSLCPDVSGKKRKLLTA